MGTKMAVAFANIFIAKIEREILILHGIVTREKLKRTNEEKLSLCSKHVFLKKKWSKGLIFCCPRFRIIRFNNLS